MIFTQETVRSVGARMAAGTPYNSQYAAPVELSPRQIEDALRRASISVRNSYGDVEKL